MMITRREKNDAADKKQETGIRNVEKDNNMQTNINVIRRIIVFMLMFLAAGLIAWLGCMLYQCSTEMMIRNIVMVLAGTGIVIFPLPLEKPADFSTIAMKAATADLH